MNRELVTFSAGYLSDAGGYGRIVNQDLIIRRYLPSDEDVVVDLWSRAAREAHPFLAGEGTGERETITQAAIAAVERALLA